MYNLNFKFPILFVFFAFILITSTIFVNQPVQSQQQISQLDDIINGYNEKIYGDETNPPPYQGGLQQQQPYTSTNPPPPNLNSQIQLVDSTPTSFENLITLRDGSTINFRFEFVPNTQYHPTQQDLEVA